MRLVCLTEDGAVLDLSAEEKRAFARATRPVFDKWAATVGTDLVRQAEAVVARAG